jgi:23S rRNA (cytidine2498-2'-O)-methyltransferase
LIREALLDLLQRKRRHLLRRLRAEPGPFAAEDSLVQLLLTGPEAGYLSVARAPMPFEQRHLISPFGKGEAPGASDKLAPSRAFAKLVEAELRLGRRIQAGETCVDLGAAPGSWTYVAVQRGARVLAVDPSPLREDLMRHGQVQFHAGDAFRFAPPRPVDWLLCDVIAAPERTAALLLEWLRRAWCRRFVVTLKLKDATGADALEKLKRELPPLTRELFLTRLCANKKEVCAFGEAERADPVNPERIADSRFQGMGHGPVRTHTGGH